MTSPFKTVRLVISELGAKPERWVDAWSAGGRPVIHLAQQRGEAMGDFVIRVREAIEALAEANRIPATAVMVGSGRVDAESLASRQFALRVLLTTLVRNGGGEVFLTGERRDKYAMQSLAQTAFGMVEGSGVRLAVVGPDSAVVAA